MELQGTAAVRQLKPEGLDSADADTLEDRVRSLRLPQPARPRRRIWPWAAAVICAALVGAGGWYAYQTMFKGRAALAATSKPVQGSGASTASHTAATPSAPEAPAAARPAAPAAPGSIALESKGNVIAAHQVLISPRVSGLVVFLNADEGRRVAKGEVLAKIESVEFQSDYDFSAAALELARQRLLELQQGNRPQEIDQAQAELGEAQAQLKQLAADWKRKGKLRTSGILTDTELEMAESQFNATQQRVQRLNAALKLMQIGARKERIAAAAAEVKQREAELAKARWRLDNCTILAPISGTILKKNAEEGNVVDAHLMNGSFSLCELADLSDIEIELKVQERDIARVHVGQQCQVRAEAYPDRVYQGVVSRLMPIADKGQAAIPVRVKVQVPAQEVGVYLKPQMGAVVTFFN